VFLLLLLLFSSVSFFVVRFVKFCESEMFRAMKRNLVCVCEVP
jgi:hypothetical protein